MIIFIVNVVFLIGCVTSITLACVGIAFLAKKIKQRKEWLKWKRQINLCKGRYRYALVDFEFPGKPFGGNDKCWVCNHSFLKNSEDTDYFDCNVNLIYRLIPASGQSADKRFALAIKAYIHKDLILFARNREALINIKCFEPMLFQWLSEIRYESPCHLQIKKDESTALIPFGPCA